MRILDVKNDKSLNEVVIYLTNAEAQELLNDLTALVKNEDKGYHTHINDLIYEHEITITIYDENDIEKFDKRSIKIIESDE